MKDIHYINITSQLAHQSVNIKDFIDALGSEMIFFEITLERMLNSVLVILALHQDKIIGITGLEKKWGIMRSYTIVKKDYQRMRIAEELFHERMRQSSGLNCNLIMAVVDKGNILSCNHCVSRGYRLVGERWGRLRYYFLPLNFKGNLQYSMIKWLFPLLRFIDKG